ncbi:MAG: hypothetical protein K0R18_1266 [Bacillales bacterium]|jgi:hypothetical protein|nr:hypothetical protein [Bacillales bacterium]
MEITKQSTSHITKSNLEKLITDVLYEQGYKALSIYFNIVSEDRKPKQKVVYPPSQVAFYGVTVRAEEVNVKSQSRSLVKVNDSTEITITEDELISLAKEYLISEGYQLVSQPYFDFTWESDGDSHHYGSNQVFNGIKCLTNKEVKNISILGEKRNEN